MRPMSRAVLLVAVAIVGLGAPPAGATHEESGSYVLPTTPVASVLCSPTCFGIPLGVGGYEFPAGDEAPARVRIADATGGPVSFTICQEFSEALCGEPGREPTLTVCGTEADLSISEVPFRAGYKTSVFVRVFDPTQPFGCTGVATTGTITLIYG